MSKLIKKGTSKNSLSELTIDKLSTHFVEQAKDLKIIELEQKVFQLQEIIKKLIPSDVERIERTEAEVACDHTIQQLTNRSYQSELSLEDMKKLDLAIKNKITLKNDRLSEKKPEKKLPDGITKEQLLQLAASTIDTTVVEE